MTSNTPKTWKDLGLAELVFQAAPFSQKVDHMLLVQLPVVLPFGVLHVVVHHPGDHSVLQGVAIAQNEQPDGGYAPISGVRLSELLDFKFGFNFGENQALFGMFLAVKHTFLRRPEVHNSDRCSLQVQKSSCSLDNTEVWCDWVPWPPALPCKLVHRAQCPSKPPYTLKKRCCINAV